MIIFFPKKGKHKEGEILFSFPEVFSDPKLGFSIKEDGKEVLNSKDLDHVYLMPLESQVFIDPHNSRKIHEYQIKFDKKGKLISINHKNNNEKLHFINKGDIKEMMDLWGGTYTVLKDLHPKLKIKEAMKKEKML